MYDWIYTMFMRSVLIQFLISYQILIIIYRYFYTGLAFKLFLLFQTIQIGFKTIIGILNTLIIL